MAKQTVEVLIEGGKATAAPPLGPAMGPLGVNIGQVVADINSKTQDFKGMQVPVKVEVDTDTKAYTISIGTPPASQLIIKEAGIKKGSGSPKTDLVADLKIEQLVKVAKMKEDSLLGKDPIQRVKEIAGTCQSMGVMIEGKPASETIADLQAGTYDQKILSGKTELTEEEKQQQEEEQKKLQEEMEARRQEFETTAKTILSKMENKDRKDKVKALEEAEIPTQLINELLPVEKEEKKEESPQS
ncbi:50S ribosomal protein L11 [Candidatus Woesearchaeota archaeon]|nr:50S ribosomal protein L11 [Candidatus Woesearchaeota archaeon]